MANTAVTIFRCISLACSRALLVWLLLLGPTGARELVKPYRIEKKVYDALQRGKGLMAAEKYTTARTALCGATRYDPTSYSASLHYQLAVCNRRLKHYRSALREAGQALRFDGKDADAVYLQALCCNDLKKYDRCLSYLDRYLSISDSASGKAAARRLAGQVRGLRDLEAGITLIGSGRYAAAVKKLRAAAAAEPTRRNEAVILANLSYALRRAGKSKESAVEGEKALALDPGDRCTAYNLAIAYQDLGRFDDSSRWLKRYLSMETDPALAKNARDLIKSLEEDRRYSRDPAARARDYYDFLRRSNHCLTWSTAHLPLKVYMPADVTAPGYKREFDSFITEALDKWCQSSGKKLSYCITDERRGCDLEIVWTDKSLDSKMLDHRLKSGLTTTRVNPASKKIEHAIVRILTVDPYQSCRQVQPGEVATVCIHEVGHALGLGHSPCISDIMYFRSSSGQTGLPTGRDRATIARLYAGYPVVAFTPQTGPGVAPVKYQPPSCFLPPELPSTRRLQPPLFLPPPVGKKIEPPLFTPPPLSRKAGGGSPARVKPPLFTPPPVSGGRKRSAGAAPERPAPPLFLPKPK